MVSIEKETTIVLFKQKEVRRYWNDDQELWYFSIVDVIEILTDSNRPRRYWNDLKKKLTKEGSELSDKIGQLKMRSTDGKYYLTDVTDTENILRLIQSIPSPKAEPFKLWLARVGYERIEETEDPELAFERAMQYYLKKGYTKDWINQRLKSIEVRKELTDEWQHRKVKKGLKYAILTDEITQAWANKSVKEYKRFKRLKKQSLRDNMTNLELILNMLAEASTTEISKKKKPKSFSENRSVAKQGGNVAGKARKELESKTGKSVISSNNANTLRLKNGEVDSDVETESV